MIWRYHYRNIQYLAAKRKEHINKTINLIITQYNNKYQSPPLWMSHRRKLIGWERQYNTLCDDENWELCWLPMLVWTHKKCKYKLRLGSFSLGGEYIYKNKK